MPARSSDEWLSLYGESHQDARNELIHWICVPAIVWALTALLWSIPFPLEAGPLNWASIFLALAVTWQFRNLSASLGMSMVAVSLSALWLCDVVATAAPRPLWQIALVVFVLAWVGQFIEHYLEGKRPSFLQDLQFLLIGPAWLIHSVGRRLRSSDQGDAS